MNPYILNLATEWSFTPRPLFFLILNETESLGTAATTGLLYQPGMIDDGDCEEIGGMKAAP
jgi:hypothetical protein